MIEFFKKHFKNNHLVRSLYSKIPSKLRINYSYFQGIQELIKETERLNKEDLEQWQFEKLSCLVNYAWENIRGYRKLWEQHSFAPTELKKLKDVNKIPFVTKEILRSNLNDFSNLSLSDLQLITTGGSTGEPFGFYIQGFNSTIEWSFVISLWRNFFKEAQYDVKRVVLRGQKIEGTYLHDPMQGLVLSSYCLNLKNIKDYVALIDKFQYPILHAYPSSLYLMAKIMKDNDVHLRHNFKAIMLGSEPVYDFQKDLIQEVFGAKICNWYGHSEMAILAGNCEFDERYHVFPQYGLTEVINGELVGTSFWNYATPFIRYKTRDYAELEDTFCAKCGRKYQLLKKINGRLQDFVVNSLGEIIPLTALIFAQHFKAFGRLEKMQILQEQPGYLILKVIPTELFCIADEKELVEKIRAAGNGLFKIELEKVDYIEHTNSGKHRFLEQKLDILNLLNFTTKPT